MKTLTTPRIMLAALALSLPVNALDRASADVPGGTAVSAPVFRKPTMKFVNGRWFDGRQFVPATWYSVDGRFTRKPPARVDVTIDLHGSHALPPLAEAHNHNLQNRWAARQMADDYIRRGIFYTAQMAAHGEMIAGYRDLLDAPGYPDVLWAEATFSASNGHPIALALANARANNIPLGKDDLIDKAFWAVDTLADVEKNWPSIAAAKPKLVKLILVDANDDISRSDPAEDGRNGLRPELVPDIVRRAHAAGARVAAHVQTADDARLAVEAGVDILAHLPTAPSKYIREADLRLDDATIARMRRQGTKVVPTIEVYRQILARKPDVWARSLTIARDNLTRLRAAGVPVLTGSDLWAGSVLDEMKALVDLGFMTPVEVIRASTETTARTLFPTRKIGRIAEGNEASFIAVTKDPTRDLSALTTIDLAVKQGEVISR